MAERQHHRNELAKLITKRLIQYANSCEALSALDKSFHPYQAESQNKVETVSCNL
jgi:hypothetical protein